MSVITKPFQWFYHEFGVDAIHDTGRNAYLIIIARSCRMFAYGTNSFFLGIFPLPFPLAQRPLPSLSSNILPLPLPLTHHQQSSSLPLASPTTASASS